MSSFLQAYLTPDARDLIRRLMKRQVSQRLGKLEQFVNKLLKT